MCCTSLLYDWGMCINKHLYFKEKQYFLRRTSLIGTGSLELTFSTFLEFLFSPDPINSRGPAKMYKSQPSILCQKIQGVSSLSIQSWVQYKLTYEVREWKVHLRTCTIFKFGYLKRKKLYICRKSDVILSRVRRKYGEVWRLPPAAFQLVPNK